MRAVWILLALLVLAGAAAAWNALTASPSPDAESIRAAEAIARASPRLDSASERHTEPTGGAAASANRELTSERPQDPIGSPSPDQAHTRSASQLASQTDVRGAPASTDSPTAPGSAREADAATLASELLAASAERADAARPSPIASTTDSPRGVPIKDGLDAKLGAATVAPGVLERLPDGSIRADDRFTIQGSGSAGDPYRITWELLASAAESYQPRLGQSSIPQRIAMLHGKYVRIEGFATFPVFSFDPTELLMMLNQWDGCCIGVPPTPYDAIEAKLASAPKERRRQAAYFGTLQGKLEVEPYLVENWLVGLYLMKDARFTLDM